MPTHQDLKLFINLLLLLLLLLLLAVVFLLASFITTIFLFLFFWGILWSFCMFFAWLGEVWVSSIERDRGSQERTIRVFAAGWLAGSKDWLMWFGHWLLPVWSVAWIPSLPYDLCVNWTCILYLSISIYINLMTTSLLYYYFTVLGRQVMDVVKP